MPFDLTRHRIHPETSSVFSKAFDPCSHFAFQIQMSDWLQFIYILHSQTSRLFPGNPEWWKQSRCSTRPASGNDIQPQPLTSPSLWCPVSVPYVAVLVLFAHVCHQRKTVIELSLGDGRYERGGGNVSWRALQMVWLSPQWQMDRVIVQKTHKCACKIFLLFYASVSQKSLSIFFFFFFAVYHVSKVDCSGLWFGFVHSL